jgi:hypothetical protein
MPNCLRSLSIRNRQAELGGFAAGLQIRMRIDIQAGGYPQPDPGRAFEPGGNLL